jgi:hypothetical protein
MSTNTKEQDTEQQPTTLSRRGIIPTSVAIEEAMANHERWKPYYQKVYGDMGKNLPKGGKYQLMTPKLVEYYIAKDRHNRKKRWTHVAYLAEELMKGRYVVTHQGIAVSVSDWIVDGGHRLLALREAGYPPIYMLIIEDVPDEAQSKVDIGAKRIMADILTLMMDSNINRKLVGLLNCCLKNRTDWGRDKFSPDVLLRELEDTREAIDAITAIKGGWSIPSGGLAGCTDEYYASKKNPKVWEFVQKVVEAKDLEKGWPILTFRDYLQTSKDKGSGGTKPQIARYIRARQAVQHYLQNKPLKAFNVPEPKEYIAAMRAAAAAAAAKKPAAKSTKIPVPAAV